MRSLDELFSHKSADLTWATQAATALIGHFHEYLIRGGFPQTALVESITQSQRLLREDIIEKVLKRDMTLLFGVRRVLELEQMFISGLIAFHNKLASVIGAIQKTRKSILSWK